MSQRKYKVTSTTNEFTGMVYTGYIGGVYAGKISGYIREKGVFEIHSSSLEAEFRGATTVRAFKEITDAIMKDFHCVLAKIPNSRIDSLRMALGQGFKIIGTSTYCDVLAVDLMRREE